MTDTPNQPATTPNPPANDDAPAISFRDLCAALGIDEDAALRQLAAILNKRTEDDDAD